MFLPNHITGVFGKTFNLVGSKFCCYDYRKCYCGIYRSNFQSIWEKLNYLFKGIVGILGILRYFVPMIHSLRFYGYQYFLFLIVTFNNYRKDVAQLDNGVWLNTVDYGEWKTGIRSEAIPFAFFRFTQKVGMRLPVQLLVGFFLRSIMMQI